MVDEQEQQVQDEQTSAEQAAGPEQAPATAPRERAERQGSPTGDSAAGAGPRVGEAGPQVGDVETGEVEAGEVDSGRAESDQGGVEQGGVEQQVAELTADLQRLSAEYTNYRKRVERDREVVARDAKASVASELLPALDDLQRADAHGDLAGGVRAIVDKLEAALRSSGLERFGTEGEAFDPEVHEAAQHEHSGSAEITEPTVTAVLRPGYRLDERVLRTALVAVTEPDPVARPAPEEAAEPITSEGPEAVAE